MQVGKKPALKALPFEVYFNVRKAVVYADDV